MAKAPVLRFLDFDKVYELSCDAFHVGIGIVLGQEGHLITFYSEKPNEAKKRYSTYDLEFYVIF